MTDFLSSECDRKIVEHWWLGLGCNVGGFFVRVANGDPSGWLFGIGMIGGAFIALNSLSGGRRERGPRRWKLLAFNKSE